MSDWELSKENIQPLSSGRHLSVLNQSLSVSSIMDRETEFTKNVGELEHAVASYQGDDILGAYHKLISYIEQSDFTGGQKNSKYRTYIGKCLQACLQIEKYQNDIRLVDIFIKSGTLATSMPAADVLKNLLFFLNVKNIGIKVSKMYVAIADVYETMLNIREAQTILRAGLEANAEPRRLLEDSLEQLQWRVAQRLSKTMNSTGLSEGRKFGDSVPTDEKNDAPSIRVELTPAVPSGAKPVAVPKSTIPILQDSSLKVARGSHIFPSVSMLLTETENQKENTLNPTKWTAPEVAVETEFIPPPSTAPTFTIFADTTGVIPTLPPTNSTGESFQRSVRFGRDLTDREESVFESSNAAPQDVVKAGTAPIFNSAFPVTRPKEAPSQPIQVQNTLQEIENLKQISQLPWVLDPSRQGHLNVPVEPKCRRMYNDSLLWRGEKQLSFEHFLADRWLKRNEDRKKAEQTDEKFAQLNMAVDNATKELDLAVNKLNLAEAEVNMLKLRNQKLEEQLQLTTDHFEQLNRLHAQEMNELLLEGHKWRERTESAESHIKMLQQKQQENMLNLFEEQKQEEFIKQMELQKHTEMKAQNQRHEETTNKTAKQYEFENQDNPMTMQGPSHPVLSLSALDENGVPKSAPRLGPQPRSSNLFCTPKAPVNRRSKFPLTPRTPEDVPLWTLSDSEEEEHILKKQDETAAVFDVSNLTKALMLNPLPVTNSTPEKENPSKASALSTYAFPDENRISAPIHPVAIFHDPSFCMENPAAAAGQSSQPTSRPNFRMTLDAPKDLSTVQETSKETQYTSSSSGNMTSTTRGFTNTTSFMTKSSSRLHAIFGGFDKK